MQQILIIEDDRALNQGLCKALKTDNSSIQVSSGLYAFETDRQIVSCENLKDAKEQMLCGMPSLILLDINLPDGSGLDFLQSVKRDCPDCPVKYNCDHIRILSEHLHHLHRFWNQCHETL